MWIVFQADDLHEISILIFSEKWKKKKIDYLLQILLFILRGNPFKGWKTI